MPISAEPRMSLNGKSRRDNRAKSGIFISPIVGQLRKSKVKKWPYQSSTHGNPSNYDHYY